MLLQDGAGTRVPTHGSGLALCELPAGAKGREYLGSFIVPDVGLKGKEE